MMKQSIVLTVMLVAGAAHADVSGVVNGAVNGAGAPPYVGVAVGVIKAGSRYQFHYGQAVRGTGVPSNYLTYFAVGSISKTFTATVLALYDHRGLVSVPPAVPPPVPTISYSTRLSDLTSYPLMWQLQGVTLEQLAMHHSMLSRDAPGPDSNYQLGSYAADYDALFDTLAYCPLFTTCPQPTSRSGDALYSNYGYQVLAKVLADLHGGTVLSTLRDEVFDEVGMYSTGTKISLTDPSCVVGTCTAGDYGDCSYTSACHGTFSARAAVGYKADLVTRAASQGSDQRIAVGSGAIWATMDDMLIWLGYNMGLKYDYWHQEMLDILPDLHIARDGTFGLAWKTYHLADGRTVIGKAGDVSGFTSWIGWVDGGTTGVIVLANRKDYDAETVGKQILSGL